ncbi:hypothetical protein ACFQ1M_16135 [Sungkyunkwania multivorans]|uniref:Uncharacterized protein n=1 Tax=Sungkyunkwania multivorans TaxID=1173618 RepID=A0ABW3D3X9_9FLAO
MKTYLKDPLKVIEIQGEDFSYLKAKTAFDSLSRHQGVYIGFLDSSDQVLMFTWKVKDQWLVEHPVVLHKLHQQRYATDADCLNFIKKIYQEYDIASFEGFLDVPVEEFTLDEMLAFQREDEMLLRGEDPDAPAPKKLLKHQGSKKKGILSMGTSASQKDNTASRSTSIPRANDQSERDFFQL